MADPQPIEKVIKKIKKKWEQDKEGWSVLSGIDRDGNQEMLINQDPHTYWLKMRKITEVNSMAFGKELTNIDDEINKQIYGENPKAIKSKQDLMRIFGLVVPSPKDKSIYTMAGAEKFSNEHVNMQKKKIEEKESNADKLYRLYLRKKWEREQQLRENMYL
jgi:Cft2 family RNA processing exonuclease